MSDGLGLRPDLRNLERHLAEREAARAGAGEGLDPPFPYAVVSPDPDFHAPGGGEGDDADSAI